LKKWQYKWQVVAAVVFGTFMVIMDATVVNVALKTLQNSFNTSINQVQWVISGYALALGVVTPLSGFLGDRFGIKRVWLICLGFFVFGSVLCALAPSIEMLIAFRILQGLGGGAALPLGTAMLFSAFPPQERGLAMGIFGIPLVMAPALGPVLGGYFVEYVDWRLIFLINIPIGGAGIWIGSKLLREKKGEGKQRFDLAGTITSVLGFGGLLYGLSSGSQDGWLAPNVVLSLAVGLVSLVAFAFIELNKNDGLVDLRLFKSPVFLMANVVGWVTTVAFFGAEFLLPLYLQVLRGLTALETGLLLLPLALTSGLLIPFTGRLYDKIGARPIVAIGFILLTVNTWQLSQISMDTPLWFIGFLLMLRGMALACVIQPVQAAALSQVSVPKLPRASSLITSSRQVFQALGVAALATIVQNNLGGLTQRTPGTPPSSQAIALFQQTYLSGLESAYLFTFWTATFAIVLALLLPGWPLKPRVATAPVTNLPVRSQLALSEPEIERAAA